MRVTINMHGLCHAKLCNDNYIAHGMSRDGSAAMRRIGQYLIRRRLEQSQAQETEPCGRMCSVHSTLRHIQLSHKECSHTKL